jgi:ribosomal protein L1
MFLPHGRRRHRKICAICQHDPAKEAEIGGIVLSFGRIIPDFFR